MKLVSIVTLLGVISVNHCAQGFITQECIASVTSLPQWNTVDSTNCEDVNAWLDKGEETVQVCGADNEGLKNFLNKALVFVLGQATECDLDTEVKFPLLDCAKCISDGVAAVEDVETACDAADTGLKILKKCAETSCKFSTESFENTVETLKTKLVERLGDDCQISADDFPKLQCVNCVAGSLKDIIGQDKDATICDKAESAATALRDCKQKSCDVDTSLMEEGISSFLEAAGDDCKLDIFDLPIDKACVDCVARAKSKVTALLNPEDGADICPLIDDVVQSLTSCADTCKVKLDKAAVESRLNELYVLTGTKCTEQQASIQSFAARESIPLQVEGEGCLASIASAINSITQLDKTDCDAVRAVIAEVNAVVGICGIENEGLKTFISSAVEALLAQVTDCQLNTEVEFPLLDCAKCISDGVSAVDGVESACDAADAGLGILKKCAETSCKFSTASFEQAVEDVKTKLVERLGDDCQISADDFPKLECVNCVAGSLKDIIGQEKDATICDKATTAVDALKACKAASCDVDTSLMEESISSFLAVAGEDCTLDIADLPIDKACVDCVQRVGQKVVGIVNPPQGADVCALIDDAVSSLTSCADTCQVKLDKDAVKENLDKVYQLTGSECTAQKNTIQAFAARENIVLAAIEDENTTAQQGSDTTSDGEGKNIGGIIGGSIAGGLFLGAVCFVVYRRRQMGRIDENALPPGFAMDDGDNIFMPKPGQFESDDEGSDDEMMSADNPMFGKSSDNPLFSGGKSSDNPLFRGSSKTDEIDLVGGKSSDNPMFDPYDL